MSPYGGTRDYPGEVPGYLDQETEDQKRLRDRVDAWTFFGVLMVIGVLIGILVNIVERQFF
jgi:hypothetical protein